MEETFGARVPVLLCEGRKGRAGKGGVEEKGRRGRGGRERRRRVERKGGGENEGLCKCLEANEMCRTTSTNIQSVC